MINWNKLSLRHNSKISDAIKLLDNLQCVFVVDEKEKLLGTITDADIRKALINNFTSIDPVTSIMNSNPTTILETRYEEEKLILSKNNLFKIYPVVDKNKKIRGVLTHKDIKKPRFSNPVFIMAGGLGSRLMPLTKDCPKPLLKIGNKPILEILINELSNYGFKEFYICINYQGEKIKNYFQDGTHLDVNINYIEEREPLGTAGALGLLNKTPKLPSILINGDIITKLNFKKLLEYHEVNNPLITMCVKEHSYNVPFGVVEIKGANLKSIKEKPVFKTFINAGIYIIDPEVFNRYKIKGFVNITDIINKLSNEKNILTFPIHEYWLDIGEIQNYNLANEEFSKFF